MAEENKTKGKLPWHSAFFAGIQIELEKDAHKLTFENEHQLGTDPMRIDVLIVKKHSEEQVQKNIGQIFIWLVFLMNIKALSSLIKLKHLQ